MQNFLCFKHNTTQPVVQPPAKPNLLSTLSQIKYKYVKPFLFLLKFRPYQTRKSNKNYEKQQKNTTKTLTITTKNVRLIKSEEN